jgi:hypothetical protein
VRGDRRHRHPAAVRIEQAVDQVQISRPAASRADCQLTGQRGLACRRERRRLLVPGVLPADAVSTAERVGEPVSESPGIPYTRRTPDAFRVDTMTSATVVAIICSFCL